jgi:regulator of RNase E activity RraA
MNAKLFFITAALLVGNAALASAQLGAVDREDLVRFTPEWQGERAPDGRPLVPDELLERLKKVSLEEAWGVCREHGYHNQFEGNWVMTETDPVLVGRAVTSYFQPLRPDVQQATEALGKEQGRIGGQNSWVIDTLEKGDVMVVDIMGRVIDATFVGDNLANSVWAKTGTGIVIDGGARDLEGVMAIPDFPIFNRGWDPSFLQGMTIMGINTPIRIGRATVMPGDVVLGKREGVMFIPPHLVQQVVEQSEEIRLRDAFGHQRLREGRWTPGQIDREWTEEIEADFLEWVREREDELTDYQRERFLGRRN